MALSANGSWVIKDVLGANPMSMIVLSGSTIYNTALCTHDTTEGDVKPFDGTQTDRFVGWHFGDSVAGNGSGARNRAKINPGGFIAKAVAVTGLNGTTPASNYGEAVYASDDGTYTLVATGNFLVGYVVADDNGVTLGTNANVYMRNVFGQVGT